jgi:hypothetical protein
LSHYFRLPLAVEEGKWDGYCIFTGTIQYLSAEGDDYDFEKLVWCGEIQE